MNLLLLVTSAGLLFLVNRKRVKALKLEAEALEMLQTVTRQSHLARKDLAEALKYMETAEVHLNKSRQIQVEVKKDLEIVLPNRMTETKKLND